MYSRSAAIFKDPPSRYEGIFSSPPPLFIPLPMFLFCLFLLFIPYPKKYCLGRFLGAQNLFFIVPEPQEEEEEEEVEEESLCK